MVYYGTRGHGRGARDTLDQHTATPWALSENYTGTHSMNGVDIDVDRQPQN